MTKRYAVILAAGQGTRMKSSLYKVLHPVLGRPMVQHVIDNIKSIDVDQIVTIVGHGSDSVMAYIGNDSEYVLQEEQLGTGHAVIQAEKLLGDKEGTTLVVCGDTPLIRQETFEQLLEYHEKEGAQATILTSRAEDPTGYGRVIRHPEKGVERIVEHKDASEEERLVDEINTGTYCFDNKTLFKALKQISNDNAQGEYYLTDVIEIIKKDAGKIAAYLTPDFDETLGVNDRVALQEAERILKERINRKHLLNGVTIIDPLTTYIHPDVKIEQDAIIHPGSIIKGKSIIKKHAEIGPYTEIVNCTVGEHTIIKQSVARDSVIGSGVQIGPYAHIRPETNVEDEAKIGNFVELKKATIGKHSKVSHLSYLGDASVGDHVNVGCGTITVNYDGKRKHVTTIEDDAFVGCNSNLIAPVTIGKRAYVAAGSTITDDVPAEALSIARSRQTNKEGYVNQLKSRKK
ncbi:bifunctional UDP-N-acetylglucosamine pyrophosphorylase/glucosamine-1-phosphate N-acetyltransferase [Cerasibacillus quisquiliarum]|uniref:Bifunctional protein GlmU n=1 Tax=Cerasibacillus quisquiliarum TaxID=227865 RepID=A0A511UXB2_9BACI|nr:bifunctional UDP-N-acetylglucosamine diphosphorylase/glucosamine-1-phosphate N-acetyltransferase GlmU [Cerasibacillus quisquiliarum]MBB5146577.1 bifunctional UDP-N-acetylglucosamine pyrophosphorylase/glucosamine-1-phosphate N-acetyltransferase [Cerasibacillus quisquiliarum]GEN31276.1 bifunctional protein GlmU [Cerasibacillus quisquiliarum]